MTSLCEVCASEPFKYRCPTCGLMSCSLGCTRTHKIYCAPKAPKNPEDATEQQPHPSETNGHITGAEGQPVADGQDLAPQRLLIQIKDLFERYPPLRDQLRDIYKATLEEQWVEGPAHKDRPRHSGRGKPTPRGHGPWTREKGFRRGLGKVRKYRGQCEDGSETGKGAEGFMRLLTLVNEGHLQEHQ
ncbi:zinc finger HIT domain-containing protein [Aspergillus foveolatus]|uniref:zinc finger HIT domain-containing protein n=1 Tax=Aspergillus foveolatus TaxID=210207 RepID=UPI003CCD8507